MGGWLKICGQNNWTPRYFTPFQVADNTLSGKKTKIYSLNGLMRKAPTLETEFAENGATGRVYRLNGGPPSSPSYYQETGSQEKEVKSTGS